MATSPTVPMYAPDGTLGDVPYDQMSAALRAGGKLGVNMTAPDGTKGVIPADHVQEAAKSGGRIIPFDLSKAPAGEQHKGIWDTFSDDVKSVFSGLWHGATEGKPTYEQTPQGAAKAIADMDAASKAGQAADVTRKAEGHGLAYRVGAGVAENVGTNVTGMEEGARTGNSDAVIGHMLAGQALAAAPLAIEGLGKVSSKVAAKASNAIAEVKPAIISELDKTHSLAGRATKAAADKILPDKPVYPGASEPAAEEFYSASGAEQDAIRRRTVAADKAAAREQTLQDRAQAKEGAPAPITESPNYDPAAFKAGVAKRTTTKAVAPAPNPFGNATATNPASVASLLLPPMPKTMPEMAGPRAEFVSKFTPPESPQIAAPEAGPVKPTISEGRPATWTNERVIQLAAKGDRNAISQAVRRGFMLPENARYVMGDMDYASGVSNPKSVTKFGPTGEPIVQGAPMEDVAYRSRDVGEQGIPADPRSHAHATTDLEDLKKLAPGRESITGKPQEFIKVDLTKLTEGKDYVRVHRPGEADWIRYLRPVPESAIERLPKE